MESNSTAFLKKRNFKTCFYEFINCSDALVSDYSSVAIDYLLLDRPLGFTLDDYEAYTESRGWVFDDPLEYMPGEHMYNMQDFENFILDIKNGKDNYKEQRASVRAKTHKAAVRYPQDLCSPDKQYW